MTAGATDRVLTPWRAAAALMGIAILAFVLPFAAVSALHVHRLDSADRQERELAAALALPSFLSQSSSDLLLGPGAMPRFDDSAWSRAPTVPLAPLLADRYVLTPDPWGNAYLVRIRVGAGGRSLDILSAGPDGIVQTPFASTTPSGDDRGIAP